MWKHVLLLGLALVRGLGGLGLWGRLGAPIFSPTVFGNFEVPSCLDDEPVELGPSGTVR